MNKQKKIREYMPLQELMLAFTLGVLLVGQVTQANNVLLVSNPKGASNSGHASGGGQLEDQLSAAERKLLQRTYEADPLPKRLQRLELLTFGATQYGSNLERWRNIKQYMSQTGTSKNNRHSKTNSILPDAQVESGGSVSESLNELEKYVFKKTFKAETTGRRLDKLEAKLFGQPSSTMPAPERIARLKRTLGLNASPHEMAGLPNRFLPPSMRGFGDPGDMLDPGFQFDSQMAQMLRQMEKQMQGQGFEQLPDNGQYEFRYHIYGTPEGGFRIGPQSGQDMNPNPSIKKEPKGSPHGNQNPAPKQMPDFLAPPLIPQPGLPRESIPSYSDPNFI